MKINLKKIFSLVFVMFFSNKSFTLSVVPDLSDMNISNVTKNNTIELHKAINNNSIKDVKEILDRSNYCLFAYYDGLTALQRALVFGSSRYDLSIFSMILKKGEITCCMDGLILKMAILMDNLEVVKMLVEAGAPLNLKYQDQNIKSSRMLNVYEYAFYNSKVSISYYLKEQYCLRNKLGKESLTK
ncbi:ankyrin repeat domain-containing protein [Candidatus Dependentiae bacterium]